MHKTASGSFVPEAPYFGAFSAAENSICTKRKGIWIPGKDRRVFGEEQPSCLQEERNKQNP